MSLSILVLAGWAAALSISDIRSLRLPNGLTLPPGVAACLCALLWDPGWFVGLGWPVLYAAVAARRGGIGGGDLKLAVPLGILVAAFGGPLGVLRAVIVSSLIGAISGLAASGRPQAGTPHGPAMLIGAVAGGCW
ncbi:prepilin peptidase [Corynebacterium uterequi]|uniref:prepilin peptidase n=1 Tax=Corynebacterium uterequi TaxID=1072256 RepID=UPI0009E42687|nr:prepilin peptidase [Corynebacterium uterequi]